MALNLRTLGVSVASISTALLSAFAFKAQIVALVERLGVSEATASQYFNNILTICLLMLIFITPVLILAGFIVNLVFNPDITHTFKTVSVSVCSDVDLDAIAKMANRQFGPRASDLPTIKRIYRQCRSVYWKVEARGVCGYFVLYGLTKSGELALKEGHFYGASPSPRHITKNLKSTKAVCASAVVGFGIKGRAGALSGLTSVINSMEFDRVYAKPIAKDGLRIVKQYGFKRVDGSQTYELDHYYVLQRS